MIIKQINSYIGSLDSNISIDIKFIHEWLLKTYPNFQIWFLDGKNEHGKVIANPNIGYGQSAIHYADGSTKEFYRIGLSANKTGISVYIMGLPDKYYLIDNFSSRLGKAKITSYCIKFKSLKDISVPVLLEAIQFGFSQSLK